MSGTCRSTGPAPRTRARRRPVFSARLWTGVVLAVVLLAMGPGCIWGPPHNTVSTLGGDAEGKRLDKAPQSERIPALTQEIRGLSPKVDPGEAEDCAQRSIRYSELMRDSYGMIKPIELNNILIDMHLKRRGLCYQMADDLMAELTAQHYRTLQFQRATAWWDDVWSEHNCVVVTAPGQPFEKGLVLDPWRNAGTLRWARVYLDHYPWVPRSTGEFDRATTKPVIAGKSGESGERPAAERQEPSSGKSGEGAQGDSAGGG